MNHVVNGVEALVSAGLNITTNSTTTNTTTTTGAGSTTGHKENKIVSLIDEYFLDPDSEGCAINHDIDNNFDIHNTEGHVQIHVIGWIVCGIAVLITLAISFYHIYLHLSNFVDKNHQKYIVRILLIVPIYSVDSWLSFRYYWLSVYFDLFRNCYEAFVIYTFFTLMINYIGGYAEAKDYVSQKSHKLPIPLCCVVVPQNRGLLRVCKRLVLQYVIINPTLAVISVILQTQSKYCPGNWGIIYGYLYITAVSFVSVTLAMYGLILTYVVISEPLQPHQPIQKFLSVKFIIFLSFWQSIVVSGLVDVGVIHATTYWTTDNVSDAVQEVLTIGEMLIAAIWHLFAYPVKGKYKVEAKTNVFYSLKHVFNPKDIMRDVYESFFPRELPRLPWPMSKDVELKQRKSAMSVEDGAGTIEQTDTQVEIEADAPTVEQNITMRSSLTAMPNPSPRNSPRATPRSSASPRNSPRSSPRNSQSLVPSTAALRNSQILLHHAPDDSYGYIDESADPL